MIDLNLEDRFKKNSLRVYNGEMQKKERIKIASKIHKDLKVQSTLFRRQKCRARFSETLTSSN